jgi:hypothetical protein
LAPIAPSIANFIRLVFLGFALDEFSFPIHYLIPFMSISARSPSVDQSQFLTTSARRGGVVRNDERLSITTKAGGLFVDFRDLQ